MYFVVKNANKLIKSDLCFDDVVEIYKQFKDESRLCKAHLPYAFYETLNFTNNIYEYQSYELEKKFAKWTYEKAKQVYNNFKNYWKVNENPIFDLPEEQPDDIPAVTEEELPTKQETKDAVSPMNDDKFNQFNVFRKRRNQLSEIYYEGFEKQPELVPDSDIDTNQLMLIMYNTKHFAILKSKFCDYLANLENLGIENIKIDYVWYFPDISLVYELASFYELENPDFLSNIFKMYKVIKDKQQKGVFYKWFLEYIYTNYEFDISSSIGFNSFYKDFMEFNNQLNYALNESSVRDIMMYFNMNIKDKKILHLKKLDKPRPSTKMDLSYYKLTSSKPKITQLRTEPNIIVDSKKIGPWMMSSKLDI